MNRDPNIYQSRKQSSIIPEMDRIQLDPILILPCNSIIAFEFCWNKVEKIIIIVVFQKNGQNGFSLEPSG